MIRNPSDNYTQHTTPAMHRRRRRVNWRCPVEPPAALWRLLPPCTSAKFPQCLFVGI